MTSFLFPKSLWLVLPTVLLPLLSHGQESSDVLEPEQVCVEGACTLTYEPAFFQRYAPITALDMLNNLPGFNVDNGDQGTRGFGGAAGNVIINGNRISAKSDSPSDILARIPASDIERIEVIRGQVGGLDLRGQNVVANVIRKGGSGSGNWSGSTATFDPGGNLYPSLDLSYSTSSDWGEATFALFGGRGRFLVDRNELLTGGDGSLRENRVERFDREFEELGGSVNASASYDDWKFGANIGFNEFDNEGGELSERIPASGLGAPFALFQGQVESGNDSEIGVDAERALGEDWQLKLIGLFRNEEFESTQSLVRGPLDAIGITETATNSESSTEETIGRIELDYSGFEGHTLELSAELSHNNLVSSFALRELNNGFLVDRPVPGANTEVEETRLDVLLSDSFRVGAISVDAALAGEDSTIKQVGGFNEDRSFFFWKPSVTLSYSPSDQTQLRVRALRNVGQLDLFDFASDVDLGDVELALGNPQLAPEVTNTFDLSYEVRGAGIGIGSVTLFHDWIEDVNDLLPLTGQLEVPGNIGSGTRSGIRSEVTLPLDSIGIKGGRIDWSGSWQTSGVDDPLTGSDRALSGERPWRTRAEFRQDLPERNFAWGFAAFSNSRAPNFGLDELDDRGQRRDMDIFLESRALKGLIVTLLFEDIFRDGDDRVRRVFAGDRSTEPLSFTESREQDRATTISLEIRGNF
ncbi:MAG: TonB-dependent receptor plug domain-containing protein [Pseudohongiellaceae bacterium]